MAKHRNGQKGFTLIELMIAMTLGLLMGGAIISVFVYNRDSFDRDEQIQRMQDDARNAVRELANDLGMAGYWADVISPASIVLDGTLAVATDCGPAGVGNWIYRTVAPAAATQSLAVTTVDNATGATANAAYACINPAEIVPGTDIVAIKRVAGAEVALPRTPNTIYLRSNGTTALMYREPLGVPAAIVTPPFTEWEYRPSIYYVRNFGVVPGDGVPTLCRKVLQFAAPPTSVTECLSQGVEDLQIEFGLDTDGDSQPNIYRPDPTFAELQTAVSARIFVLARSVEADRQYTNDKTYAMSNSPPYTPADNFYRRVFSISVNMYNLRALRAFGS